jgi:hypothetical protein
MYSFMIDRGVYTPPRSIQGALNSTTQFQARMSEAFKNLLKKEPIIWIDDLLGYCRNYEDWFNSLEETLKIAAKYNLKFNATKCDLFAKEIKFCRRVFSTEGVEHDPARIEVGQYSTIEDSKGPATVPNGRSVDKQINTRIKYKSA